ncbi:site-specific integrase [Lactococcus ileimucosae]|uniref:Site-specific integrase n=1 Tax=Lactococcus ileimucosae TaxID=2941329 RepID=A0ABV4D4B5_9LACT
MKIETITKKDGTTVYRTAVYLGVDSLTGKKVKTYVTAKTKKALKSLSDLKIAEFERNGKTRLRKKVEFENFESLANAWLEDYLLTVKSNSQAMMKSHFKRYIIPALGSYKVEKISAPLLQSIVNDWAKKANTASISKGKRPAGASSNYGVLLNTVQRILDYAFQLGVISSNPARMVIAPRLKARGKQNLKHLDKKQLKVFLDYLDSLEQTDKNVFSVTLYKLLLDTGLRIGEALALNWSDIDYNENIIHVNKTVDRLGKVQDSPKSKSGVRDISVSQRTMLMLKQWQNRQRVLQQKHRLSTHIVFSSSVGGYLSRGHIAQTLDTHYKNAGLALTGFHAFRHTHASLLLNAGADYKEIQHRLGHSKIGMTIDTYSHLAPDKAKETASIYEQALKNLG